MARAATGTARPRAKAPPAKRTAARRKRDPEGMQRKILEAATEEFATHGFGGARVERISRRAHTVDRMLYYYFGSKEQLFRSVLERAYEQLGEAEQRLQLEQTPPRLAMVELIAFTWEYYCAHPEFIRLLNSENLHRGQHLKKSTRLAQLSFPLLRILAELLERGERAGVFRKALDPVEIYLTIAALGYFYLSNRYTLSRFLGQELMDEDRRSQWLEHMTRVVLDHVSA